MFDRLILISLGIFTVLFGIAAVTNIEIVWMKPITGLAALVCGVVCLIRAVAGPRAG
jgi:uncharacterized membrane protein